MHKTDKTKEEKALVIRITRKSIPHLYLVEF
jgi:hypothetical protein